MTTRRPVVNTVVRVCQTSKAGIFEADVLVTSITPSRDERGRAYLYVGWRQVPDHWNNRLGAWGFFRLYAEPQPYGTTIIERPQIGATK